jgi:hypothetical protein
MRVSELTGRLRLYGLTVVEVAGCHTRGLEFPSRPDGAIRHWTAGPISGVTPTLGVVTNGRSDLVGPLCNVYQSRSVDAAGLDIAYVVATGKANHAGEGTWNGTTGNYGFLGLEIEWAGPTENFLVRRRKETSERIMRAMLDCCAGVNPNDVCEHREYAPKRKIDTNLSGAELRRRMTEIKPGDDDGDDDLSAASDEILRVLKQHSDTLRNLEVILKDGGDKSVYWNGHWTREMVTEMYEQMMDDNSGPASEVG